MTTSPTRHRRLHLAGACAMTLALAAGAIALPAAPAHAADPITANEQPHFAYYHLDQARAKGYTGKGVTIALIVEPCLVGKQGRVGSDAVRSGDQQ